MIADDQNWSAWKYRYFSRYFSQHPNEIVIFNDRLFYSNATPTDPFMALYWHMKELTQRVSEADFMIFSQ